MIRSTFILFCLLSLVGSPSTVADEAKLKSVQLAFFDSHTIDLPNGWKRVEDKERYQIESGDGEIVLTATKYEAKKDGWDTFWKTRMKPDFPTLKSSGQVEMVSHKEKDYRKHPFSILCRYEGKVRGSEIVYYTVSINCGDFFISANFVGDSKSLPPDTDLPASILKSIRPKEVKQDAAGLPATPSKSKSEDNKKPQPKSEGRSR